jgi:hypothetical protein
MSRVWQQAVRDRGSCERGTMYRWSRPCIEWPIFAVYVPLVARRGLALLLPRDRRGEPRRPPSAFRAWDEPESAPCERPQCGGECQPGRSDAASLERRNVRLRGRAPCASGGEGKCDTSPALKRQHAHAAVSGSPENRGFSGYYVTCGPTPFSKRDRRR